MLSRRSFARWGAITLGNVFAWGVVISGAKYLLDPLSKKGSNGLFRPLARLSQLKVGEPQAFAVIAKRQDAWVRYPAEPIGSVWLIRQVDGTSPVVLALSAECPHLSCPVNLAADHATFLCPCHQASFRFDGQTLNTVSPRAMDALEVQLSDEPDPEIAVRFVRFQPQSSEKKPLV